MLDAQFRVQLLKVGQMPVAELITSGNGEVTFNNIPPGTYQIKVTGTQIQDTLSDVLELSGYEGHHMEFVHVTPTTEAEKHTPPGTSSAPVSAKALAVPKKALKELEKGNDEARHQNWETAETDYRKLTDEYPDFAPAYTNLGVVCMRRKDFACARDSWEKANQLDPGSPQGYFNLARIRILENSLDNAEKLLRRGLSLDPKSAAGMVMLAQVELTRGDYQQAVLYAQKAHTVPHEAYVVTHLIAGNALVALHKFAEAAAEYRTLLKESPQSAAAGPAQAALQRIEQATTARNR
jgi:Flp pilus assembly protein TadD